MKNIRHKADTELVRQQNRSLVLEALRKNGTLASIELGEKTQLSPATISAITNDMLAERLIEADKEETARNRSIQRGRPKVKLKLAASAAYVLGIRVTHNTITLLMADFCGGIEARKTVDVETVALSANAFSEMLVEHAVAFLDELKINAKHVSVISVACQGSVDAIKGEIIWSPAFSARNIPIAAPLSDAIGARCIVANDTNTIAHILHVEDEKHLDSFAVLYLGSGIGLGVYVNDALLEGAEGSASEFGHILWRENGALCRCGRKGCIEAYASDFGIYRAANKDLANTLPADITPSHTDIKALADAARAGEKEAKAAFEQAGTAIGSGLGNLIILLNPRRILFTGPGTDHFDLISGPMEAALDHATKNGHQPDISVINDDRDLIEVGLLALAYTRLDREIFAKRVSIADVAARQQLLRA